MYKRQVLDEIYLQFLKRSKDLGLDDIDLNISVIPNRFFALTLAMLLPPSLDY